MHEDENKKDLTGALKALEFNNAIIKPEEKKKQDDFAEQQASIANDSLIRPLRTFESDSAEAIKQGQQSLYSIAQAEKAKRAKRGESDPEKEDIKKNSALLLLSGALFLAGGAFLLYFFLLRTFLPDKTVLVTPTINSVITSQHEIDLANTDQTSRGAIVASVRTVLGQNPRNKDEIENIRITKDGKDIDISDIILDFSENTPPSLLRSFSTNEYMIGSIQKETKLPFFITKINYYDNAFAGMLKWEEDMQQVFVKLGISALTTAPWRDAIVKNKDVRLLKNESGDTVMLYGFYDKETLVIAPSEEVFSDVLAGLRARQTSR